jgi:preprotein translocase subunit SecD
MNLKYYKSQQFTSAFCTLLAFTTLFGCNQQDKSTFKTLSPSPQSTTLCAIGGTRFELVVEKPVGSAITSELLEEVKKVLLKRITNLGVTDALVKVSSNISITVDLPGVSDTQEAEKVLGGTAQLDLREQKPDTEAALSAARQQNILAKALFEGLKKSETKDPSAIKAAKENLQKSNLAITESFTEPKITGKNLKTAQAESHQQSSDWDVSLRFDETGGKQFADLTKNLAGTGRGIGIFLDGDLLSSPTVDAQYKLTGISGGNAVINGNFTARDAETLAISLRGGALPTNISIVEARAVKPNPNPSCTAKLSDNKSIFEVEPGKIVEAKEIIKLVSLYQKLDGNYPSQLEIARQILSKYKSSGVDTDQFKSLAVRMNTELLDLIALDAIVRVNKYKESNKSTY